MNQVERDRLDAIKGAKKKVTTQKQAAEEIASQSVRCGDSCGLRRRGDHTVIHEPRACRSNQEEPGRPTSSGGMGRDQCFRPCLPLLFGAPQKMPPKTGSSRSNAAETSDWPCPKHQRIVTPVSCSVIPAMIPAVSSSLLPSGKRRAKACATRPCTSARRDISAAAAAALLLKIPKIFRVRGCVTASCAT